MSEPPRLRLAELLHGADYYPEQWPAALIDEDLALMDGAGVNALTVGVFAWAELEPSEGVYVFDWLDRVFDRLHRAGKRIILATPGAAPPAWLPRAYPDVMRAGPDGRRRRPGNRGAFCWSSAVYREKAAAIAAELAARYGDHPALLLWHVNNEYGGACHCETCAQAFRAWLKAKFDGDLDRLNAAYWTKFWSHTYTNWDQLDLPGEPYGETSIQGLSLDFRRFTSDQIVAFFEAESAPLRARTPDVPITTNLMGFYDGLDGFRIGPHLDVSSWDSYPQAGTQAMDAHAWGRVAMGHDLARSLGSGKPWLLMESTPSSANWFHAMHLKPPGLHRFEAVQAVAHGSDSAMYFQWRQSRGGEEKLHGAVVQTGQAGRSRVYREVADVGRMLGRLAEVAGSTVEADAAVMYDWEVAWALEGSSGPVRGSKRYFETVLAHYLPFWEASISVDVVSQSSSLEGYKLLVAPMLYLLKPGVAARLRDFVERGGRLIGTYLSGWVDENDLVFEEGVSAPLADLFGIRTEELDALFPDQNPAIVVPRGQHIGVEGSFPASDFAELFAAESAEVVGTYGKFWYAERPAIVRKRVGQGETIFVGGRLGKEFLEPFIAEQAIQCGVVRNYPIAVPSGVTVQRRVNERDEFLFLLNASANASKIAAPGDACQDLLNDRPLGDRLVLPPYGVAVLRRARQA